MQFGFRVILHLPLFFSRSTSSNCSSLLFFLDQRTFNVQILQSKFFMHNLFECRQEILLKQMACKRRSWVHHKRQKTVAFSGFEKIRRPNSPIDVLHAQFISISSIDSVERNGVQKAFLGTPQKAENCCFFWFWEDSTSKFCNRSSSWTIYLSVVNRFCWKKWRAKGVLGYITKGTKRLLLLELTKTNVQIQQ